MNKLTILAVLLASSGVQAGEIGLKGGSDYFAAAINSDKTAAGVQFGAEFSQGRSDHYLAEANVGYGLAFGALKVAPRVGAFWTNINESDNSQGANAGIRLMAPLPKANHTWLYVDYSLSPDVANYKLHAFQQLEAGVYTQPAKWLSISAGYRYIANDGDYGVADQTLVDALFIGAAVRF